MTYEPQDRFRERLSPEVVFFQQLKKCLDLQSSDPESDAFKGAVNGLLCAVPKKVRDRVHGRKKDYEEDVYRFEYREFCGKQQGSEAEPKTRMNWDTGELHPIPYLVDEEGNPTKEIDWDSPHISSPRRVRDTLIDWEEILRITMEEAEDAGLSWQVDEVEQDAGDTEEWIERRKTSYRLPRTPEGEVMKVEYEDEEDDEEKREERLPDPQGA
jgi:hypothetical protein